MMSGTARALAVVCLIVTAGCVGFSPISLPTELAGYMDDPDNPYHDDELTVAITANRSECSFAPLVRQSLTYWEQHDERYLGYSVNFTLVSNATDPDLRVTFIPELFPCDEAEGAAGCAPLITDPSQTTKTIDIRALGGLSNESTVRVLKHELGHALGLAHGDPPQELMKTQVLLTRSPKDCN